jgi:multisubunit Na+/H+ antiporter MnhG subunit
LKPNKYSISKNKTSTDKSFGVFFGCLLLALSLYFFVVNNELKLILILLGICLILIGFFFPGILRRPNKAWTWLGLTLARVISPIFLALLFYFIITPIGFIMKFTNYDPLRLKNSSNLKTYWIKRKKEVGSMENQF